MSRGDQRERDRAKNLAKQQQKAKANTKVRSIELSLGMLLLWVAWRGRHFRSIADFSEILSRNGLQNFFI